MDKEQVALKSILHIHHSTRSFVDYIANFVAVLQVDHESMNVFPQLIDNTELVIDLHQIHEQAEIKTIIEYFLFIKQPYNIVSFIMN